MGHYLKLKLSFSSNVHIWLENQCFFRKSIFFFLLITVYAGQMIWWCERCLCQPTHNLRCVHWDLLHTTHEPQMHKHRNSNVICHLFPTRQIYAHKSFPMLCFGGFIAIIGHLCHSHPVPSVQSLGKNLAGLNFWSHQVFSCNITFS